jgi:hypothetical protein
MDKSCYSTINYSWDKVFYWYGHFLTYLENTKLLIEEKI